MKSKTTKPFKFIKRPSKGRVWAKLYSLSNTAIPIDEPLCYGEWDEGGIGCATTAVALGLCDISEIRATGAKIYPVRGGWNIDLKSAPDAIDEYKAVEQFLTIGLDKHLTPADYRAASRRKTLYAQRKDILRRLMNFLIVHNDYYSPFRDELGCDCDWEENDAVRLSRTKYVKKALREAAKYARAHA